MWALASGCWLGGGVRVRKLLLPPTRQAQPLPPCLRRQQPQAGGQLVRMCATRPEVAAAKKGNDIAEGEVQVWFCFPDDPRTRDPQLLKAYHNVVSDDEYAAIAGDSCDPEHGSHDKEVEKWRHRLLTRALVRSTLADYSKGAVLPRDLTLQKNAYGKPSMQWPTSVDPKTLPRLEFSLSHTDSLIALAVTVDQPVGLDVERTERSTRVDPLTFARRRFAPSEAYMLESIQDKHARRQRFMQLWTLKEAYMKALGRGINAVTLSGYGFDFCNAPVGECTPHQPHISAPGGKSLDGIKLVLHDSTTAARHGAQPDSWRLLLLKPTPHHVCAVCVHASEAVESLRVRTFYTVPLVHGSPFVVNEYLGCSYNL
eukprot:jgi/Chlat1/8857/Chrsp91S08187